MILPLRLHASLRRSLKQEIGEIGDQSLNEQSIDQQIEQIEHLDGLTVTVGPNSLIRTVKAGKISCLQATILLVISHMKLCPLEVCCLLEPPTTACWACEEQSCHESSLMYHHSVLHAHNDSNTFDKNNLHRWCQLMNGAFCLLLTSGGW
jgi:hypothetical protein